MGCAITICMILWGSSKLKEYRFVIIVATLEVIWYKMASRGKYNQTSILLVFVSSFCTYQCLLPISSKKTFILLHISRHFCQFHSNLSQQWRFPLLFHLFSSSQGQPQPANTATFLHTVTGNNYPSKSKKRDGIPKTGNHFFTVKFFLTSN